MDAPPLRHCRSPVPGAHAFRCARDLGQIFPPDVSRLLQTLPHFRHRKILFPCSRFHLISLFCLIDSFSVITVPREGCQCIDIVVSICNHAVFQTCLFLYLCLCLCLCPSLGALSDPVRWLVAHWRLCRRRRLPRFRVGRVGAVFAPPMEVCGRVATTKCCRVVSLCFVFPTLRSMLNACSFSGSEIW
jgi:hypothetical protein